VVIPRLRGAENDEGSLFAINRRYRLRPQSLSLSRCPRPAIPWFARSELFYLMALAKAGCKPKRVRLMTKFLPVSWPNELLLVLTPVALRGSPPFWAHINPIEEMENKTNGRDGKRSLRDISILQEGGPEPLLSM